ncbi:MAG: RES superfamily protein [Flavobacteriaceae bacterium CG_4_8_14_3_um_filter_34_10]|nr:RES family NAD+ phosphorylase [Flavobacteriia bacterium]OIP48929.1 MAG: hypothetical protein AUK33_11895 [Flavobacteriaceae bacterium CG2_30_34_30]PIQ17725.1 MAG: RES superfamily protein [Flavobacteriaceae bacterium CG18_big_fil_WC_8_21_14_2_50_34_36]PIV51454.1 MAG: RES superfamily protein [Flavobacteriaceae bacterium CG02_land_8_20_14_3_00_34_13]PIX09519.1 MAG: RES superfamily protein [Flavobacteriaceae bacterium CG_4_8_14_3_um_filter_34_10]PIZ07756.1 MAG: RES superfamily protein [Flavobac
MKLYRISNKKYAENLLGTGAWLYGGRWNSKGIAVVYTSGSIALAVLENLVYFDMDLMPKDLVLTTLEIPESISIQKIAANQLQKDWNCYPHTEGTQQLGNRFVKDAKHLLLRVPSAIVSQEFNYILNPSHPDFKKIKICKNEVFSLNERLFKNM